MCVGCKVVMIKNIWNQGGIYNSACGEVVDIIYKEGNYPPSIPDVIMVKFEHV